MSPLKETLEVKTESDEVASLLDDDDSFDEEEDEGNGGDETSSVVARDGSEQEGTSGHNTRNTHSTNNEGQRQSRRPSSDDHRQQRQSIGYAQLNNTRDAASRRNSAATTATLKNPPNNTTNMYGSRPKAVGGAMGVAFDMNQPWERSLMRQLEKVEADDTGYFRPDFMLVGHTESSDFGLPLDQDDAASLGTSVSSTVPTRNQFIHRTILNQQEQMLETNIHEKKKPARRDSVASQLTMASEDERDDDPNATIPSHLAAISRKGEQKQRKSLPEKNPNIHYLELEVDNDSFHPRGDVSDSASSLDPACLCMGYNVWDYVLPPQQPKGRRNSTLFRVDEYPEADKPEASPTSSATHYHHTDPEGSYQPYSVEAAGL